MTEYLKLKQSKVLSLLILLLGTCTAIFSSCSCANKAYKPGGHEASTTVATPTPSPTPNPPSMPPKHYTIPITPHELCVGQAVTLSLRDASSGQAIDHTGLSFQIITNSPKDTVEVATSFIPQHPGAHTITARIDGKPVASTTVTVVDNDGSDASDIEASIAATSVTSDDASHSDGASQSQARITEDGGRLQPSAPTAMAPGSASERTAMLTDAALSRISPVQPVAPETRGTDDASSQRKQEEAARKIQAAFRARKARGADHDTTADAAASITVSEDGSTPRSTTSVSIAEDDSPTLPGSPSNGAPKVSSLPPINTNPGPSTIKSYNDPTLRSTTPTYIGDNYPHVPLPAGPRLNEASEKLLEKAMAYQEEATQKVSTDIYIDRELKQICKDLQRGIQLTINGRSISIDSQSPNKEAKVKQQLRELIPPAKQAQILPLLHQGLIAAALDYISQRPTNDSLSQAIAKKDVFLNHSNHSPISIELDTEQRQVTLTFSQGVYGTVCLEDGQFEEKIMDPEANLGTLKISFTIPVEKVVPEQGERDMIIDQLPPGTTYQLLPQDPLDSAFSEYMALDCSYVHISDDVPASVDNNGEGFLGALGARTKNLMSDISRSLSNFLPGSSSPIIPEKVSQDEECENIDPEQVKEIAKAGQSVIKNIYENSEPRFENQTAIIQLMHLLYEKAHEKRQAFDEGTYVLADPDAKLFQAFSKFEGAYPRWASHSLGEKKSQSRHYGIDLPESTIQPLDKKHILFFSFTGQDGQQKLFLKPENYGTKNRMDSFFHALEYVESLAKRNGLINPEANQQVHRKERVKYLTGEGKRIVQDFKAWIASLPDQEKAVVDHIQKQVDDGGIAYIWLWLNTHANQVRNNEALSAISNRLQAKFDHLGCRTANEVIFSHEELMQGYAESSVDEE